MKIFRQVSWSPYVVGALIGVLSWFVFASVDKPLGITTAFEYSAALMVQGAAGTDTAQAYFADPDKRPKIDWEWMLVIGVFVGAWISARLSGDRPEQPQVPALWSRRFGASRGKRYAAAFIGGMLLMLGARFAQGCTSGHGISGSLQLAVSSLIFVAVFAAASVAAASAIYRHGGRDV